MLLCKSSQVSCFQEATLKMSQGPLVLRLRKVPAPVPEGSGPGLPKPPRPGRPFLQCVGEAATLVFLPSAREAARNGNRDSGNTGAWWDHTCRKFFDSPTEVTLHDLQGLEKGNAASPWLSLGTLTLRTQRPCCEEAKQPPGSAGVAPRCGPRQPPAAPARKFLKKFLKRRGRLQLPLHLPCEHTERTWREQESRLSLFLTILKCPVQWH